MKKWTCWTLISLTLAVPAFGQDRRTLQVDDLYNLKTVRDPRLSPEGSWVAYTVTRLDREKDASDSDIYMVPVDGGEAVRLTTSDKSESSPRWSPDGRYLAFLSSRDGEKNQVWLLDRRGGEGFRLTDFKSGVSFLAWSPDGKRLALVVRDPDPGEEDSGDDNAEGTEDKEKKEKRPRPIVVNRLQFKRDRQGYLNERKNHLHVLDLETRKSFQLTDDPYDDEAPAWSPNGRWIAFSSNRTAEPDSNNNTDIYLVEVREGAEPRAVSDWHGSDSSPAFSPDGHWIAYLAGGEPRDIWYATNNLAVARVEEGRRVGESRILTRGLDRNVRDPAWSSDGKEILFLLEDRGNQHLASVPLSGGGWTRSVAGERVIRALDTGPSGRLVVLESRLDQPDEVSVVHDSTLTRITRVNDDFLQQIRLAPVKRFQATNPDGTTVDGFLTLPPDAEGKERLPTILRIHGGPVAQFSSSFHLEWQILAGQGYAVVGANPRGSSGRGRDFSYQIWADWGNKDFQDVLAAVDHVIQMGVADEERLGVGGWSYGGILTNYVITQTDRFKAAISGASEVNYTANYGHDHYQLEWEAELGLPWENLELWLRLSPFFRVDRITTPTLVMCGQLDWNVPVQNSEQLYQALRRLGVETQLVVYPGESHGLRRPSFRKDRLVRYIEWYDRYLKPEESPGGK